MSRSIVVCSATVILLSAITAQAGLFHRRSACRTACCQTAAVSPATVSSPVVVAPAQNDGWVSLFDGKSLGKWKSTEFGGEGSVEVKEGMILIPIGSDMTGITWTGELPRMSYEIALEAQRVDGSDFFCGLTFPIDKDYCSLILGGWGGSVVGISSLDGLDAANNDTTKVISFKKSVWYKVRLRVTPGKIEAWIDNEQVVDVNTEGKKLGIRGEVEASKPLGISTWQTTGAARAIKIKKL